MSFARKLYFIFLFVAAFTFCCGRQQTEKCLIQSFYRKIEGNGILGSGNLLRVRRLASTDLSFTGSCIDSANETEFLMQKKEVNGSLIVSFFRGPADDPKKYVLAIRNQTLLIQPNNIISKLQSCHQFVLASINADDNIYNPPPSTLKCTLSHSYLRSDSSGRPSVGRNSSDVTTWFRIVDTCVCDTGYSRGKCDN